MHLVDVLRDRHELRDRPEGTAPEVQVQPGHDHSHAEIGEFGHQLDQSSVEELGLVDAHDLDTETQLLAHLAARRHRHRGQTPVVPSCQHVSLTTPGVGRDPEHLDALAGDQGATEPAHQLLALAREHAAGDHLDAAAVAPALLPDHGGSSGGLRGAWRLPVSSRFQLPKARVSTVR